MPNTPYYIVKRTEPYGNVKITIYSIKNKKHKELNIKLKSFLDIYPVRQIFTHIERLDFEVFGGLIVMNLNLDHIITKFPHLVHLIVNEEIYNSYLVITHIFENSKISQFDTISTGSLIDTVNNIKVRTLDQYRKAILKPVNENSNKFIIIKTMNNDMVILKLNELLKQEAKLIKQYTYEESNTSLELKKSRDEEREDSDKETQDSDKETQDSDKETQNSDTETQNSDKETQDSDKEIDLGLLVW